MSLERVMLALSNPATYAFLVGWALAELRAWVAGRLTLRRLKREAEAMQHPRYQAVLRALERSEAARQGLAAGGVFPDPPNDDLGGHHGQH